MGRPTKRRTSESYIRDIEHLARLMTAIRLDSTLDKSQAEKAVQDAETLTHSLLVLYHSVNDRAEKQSA